MIDDGLQLGRPFRQVLHFIQKDVGRPLGAGGLVEGLSEDAVLVPGEDCKQRCGQVAQRRELVKLNAQDAVWLDAFGSDQVLDDLLLQGRLPDLTRAAQNNGRRKPGMQLPAQDIERPAAVGRKDTSRSPLPPRVRPTEMSVDLERQANSIKDVGLGKS